MALRRDIGEYLEWSDEMTRREQSALRILLFLPADLLVGGSTYLIGRYRNENVETADTSGGTVNTPRHGLT